MVSTAERDSDPTVFDAVLISARAGESWAFDDLFRRVARRLVGFLRAQGAPDPDGLANEVLLRAFRHIGGFEGTEARFRAWVFTIARNLLADEWRKRARRPEDVPTEPGALPEVPGEDETAAGGILGDRLRRHLEALSGDQREVVLMRIVADLSVEETARVIGKSPGAVKALQHRAIRALRKRLEAEP